MLPCALHLSAGYSYRVEVDNPILKALAHELHELHRRPSLAEAEAAFYDPGNTSAPTWLARLASLSAPTCSLTAPLLSMVPSASTS